MKTIPILIGITTAIGVLAGGVAAFANSVTSAKHPQKKAAEEEEGGKKKHDAIMQKWKKSSKCKSVTTGAVLKKRKNRAIK